MKAYYDTILRLTPLTETAHERLATLAQRTEVGAGMYVALKDLEIRGAGKICSIMGVAWLLFTD